MVIKLASGFNRDFAAPVLILYHMNVFVLAILGYFLYRFIAGFLVPLFRATGQMRQQFHNMNQQPPPGGQPGNPTNSKASGEQPGPTGQGSEKVGEYIDFEEVKGK
jgi:hypothetical protein